MGSRPAFMTGWSKRSLSQGQEEDHKGKKDRRDSEICNMDIYQAAGQERIGMDKERPVKIRIENLGLSFGGVTALDDVSLDIRENEVLAIIGPNGAGKTAFLNCLNGFYKPQKGEI